MSSVPNTAKSDIPEEYLEPSNQDYLSYYITQREWKPTRPLRPIGAMSSSPGPAIVNLPSTIGEDKHDPTRAKAPGYKIGNRFKRVDESRIGPGPGKYDIRDVTNKGKENCKAPKIGTANRFSYKTTGASPGPAAYNRETGDEYIYPSAPAYSVPNAPRGKANKAATTPGPNAYSLPPVFGPGRTPVVTGPAYSVGKATRMRETKFAPNPGPAAYMLPSTNVNMNQSPAYTMSSKAGPPKAGVHTPGPAAHGTHLVKFDKYSTPRITFGIRHSPYKALPGFAAEK